MGWRDRLLNSKPETVGRAMKFGGGRILSQQDLPRAGMKKGSKPWGTGPKPGSHEYFLQDIHKDKRSKKQIGGRANLLEEMGRIDARRHPDAADRAEKHRVIGELNRGYNKGGRVGAKKGGDGKWIQKVNASIKRRGTKGKCTPITKPGCTGRAKALAKTFKKMAANRKKSA